MPFKSQAQRRFMHATDPAMAERWEKDTPKGRKLPPKVGRKKPPQPPHTYAQFVKGKAQ